MRWLPDKLGLVNHGAFMLQINEVRPDDTFIVSYPKSGNTWVRFILAQILSGQTRQLSFNEVEDIVPDVYRSKDAIDKMPSPRFIKTHDVLFRYYPKTIYVVRDYRDVLVSFYHYKLALKEYEGDFSSFIRSADVREPFGSWKDHVSKALAASKEEHPSLILFRYEDIKSDFEKTVREMTLFCGIQSINTEELKEITRFDKLRKVENESGSEFLTRSKQNFFREGQSGVWQSYFGQSDLDYLYSDHELVTLMNQFGYFTG